MRPEQPSMPQSKKLAAVSVLFCACCTPTQADDWEKYNQPGQQERRTSNEDMQRGAIDKVQNRIIQCRDSAMAYQHMKQSMVDLAIEAHTKRPEPLDYYREAFEQCMKPSPSSP